MDRLNLINRIERFKAYRRDHPDATVIPLSRVYFCAWQYFAAHYKLKQIAPPLYTDHTPLHDIPKVDNERVIYSYGRGHANLPVGDYYGLTDVPIALMSHIYELRFYTTAYRNYIRTEFDGLCNTTAIIADIVWKMFHMLAQHMEYITLDADICEAYGNDEAMAAILSKCNETFSYYKRTDPPQVYALDASRLFDEYIVYQFGLDLSVYFADILKQSPDTIRKILPPEATAMAGYHTANYTLENSTMDDTKIAACKAQIAGIKKDLAKLYGKSDAIDIILID